MSAALEHSKNAIRRNLDNVLKVAAGQSANGPLESDVEQLICNVIEAIFIHGLMDAFFLKGSRFSKYPDPNIWPFISKFTHGSIKKQIVALKQIKTEIGKSRAWIRIVLNEGTLEHYIQMITKDESQLNQFYLKSAFLRDGEKVEAFNGYLKALAKLNINSATNSTVLNNWNPKPLMLAGLISDKTPPKKDKIFPKSDKEIQTDAMNSHTNPLFSRLASNDDDERSSVYSHPSMLDQMEPIRQSFQNLLPGTPENEQIINFQDSQRSQTSSDVVVRRRKGRIRSLSKSSNGSSTNISRNISLTAISQLVEGEAESKINEVTKEEASEQILFKAKDILDHTETNVENIEIEDTLVGNPFEEESDESRKNTESEEIPLIPTETPQSSSFNDSNFSQTEAYSVSLHDEFILSGCKDDSGVSGGGNSIQGYILSPARKMSAVANQRSTSMSSTSSGPPIMSFDAEMRSVLANQNEEEQRSLKNSPQPCDSIDGKYECLIPDKEFTESELLLDSKSDVVIIEDTQQIEEKDEFGVEKSVTRILTEIQRENGLASQNFRCFSCLKSIGGSSFLPFKTCALDAKYYCEDCMKRGNESSIPARIILNWDHKPRTICRASKEFLKTVYDRPIIRVDRVNPLLYDHAPQLVNLHKLRVKLSLAAMYLLSCKKSVADDLKRRLYPHEYLYTDIHLYSIKDLESTMTGTLERRLNIVIDFAANHILSCVLCIQKGFLCELCRSPQVIYPFQTEITHRCKQCYSVYHQECIKSQECPKCQRKANKLALAKEAEFMFT